VPEKPANENEFHIHYKGWENRPGCQIAKDR
jgi:hypothetical protein